MILVLAVFVGLLAGLLRARITRRSLRSVQLKGIWILLLGVVLQVFSLQMPISRQNLAYIMIPLFLLGSQLLLLVFVWFNRKQPGAWALGLGLVFNLLVMSVNGGWMPISPNTATELTHTAPASGWSIGERFGNSKDVLLKEDEMKLGWLSDRFLTPDWFPMHAAFSLGDILIALGTVLLLYSLGAPNSAVLLFQT